MSESKHTISRRIETKHCVALTAADVLALLQKEGHLPQYIKALSHLNTCLLDESDGMTLEWVEIEHEGGGDT